MPPKSKLKWWQSNKEEDFWLVICFYVRFREEEERTSKKAWVLGTASAVRLNFWPIISQAFSLVLIILRKFVIKTFKLLAVILKRVYGREVNNQVLHGMCPKASVASIV